MKIIISHPNSAEIEFPFNYVPRVGDEIDGLWLNTEALKDYKTDPDKVKEMEKGKNLNYPVLQVIWCPEATENYVICFLGDGK